MGVLGKRNAEPVVWTEHLVLDKVKNFISSPKYVMNNLYVFHHCWESDYCAFTKSDYIYEIEVKISRADFKNDKKKVRKHQVLEGTYVPHVNKDRFGNVVSSEKVYKPHYFYYAVPKDLISVDEVPEYAGLIYVKENGFPYEVVKKAPQLHKEKYTPQELNLLDKFYYNMVNWKTKFYDNSRENVRLRQVIKESAVDSEGKQYQFTLGEYDRLYHDYLNENVRLQSELRTRELDAKSFVSEIRFLKNKISKLEEELGKH